MSFEDRFQMLILVYFKFCSYLKKKDPFLEFNFLFLLVDAPNSDSTMNIRRKQLVAFDDQISDTCSMSICDQVRRKNSFVRENGDNCSKACSNEHQTAPDTTFSSGNRHRPNRSRWLAQIEQLYVGFGQNYCLYPVCV
jgi:hypothetical protein